MKDIYLMNKMTGEIEPYENVRKAFYSVPRAWDESIWDEWVETVLEVEGTVVENSFTNIEKLIMI